MKKLLVLALCIAAAVGFLKYFRSETITQMGEIQIKEVALSDEKIVAKIVNTGEQQYRRVLVEFYVFDEKGTMVHNYIHSVKNIRPAEERMFDLSVIEKQAASVKIHRILEISPAS